MGRMVFAILQMRALRIQFSVSVLILAMLFVRRIYWKCRGRNPYVYGYLWILPWIGLFAGKSKWFEGRIWEKWFWNVFVELPVFGIAYLIIALLFCLGYGIQKRRLSGKIRKYDILSVVENGGRRCEIRKSDLLHSPYTVGVFRPCIVLPADYEERYGKQELETVILHEMTHIRCHHNVLFTVASLVKCICWMNPVVCYSARKFQTDMEIFCDGKVAEQKDYVEYGKLILRSVFVPETPENILQKVNLFFSGQECRTRIILLAGHRERYRQCARRILWGVGICAAMSVCIVLIGSRHSVQGERGIETVLVAENREDGVLAEVPFSSGDYEQIVKEETGEHIIIDTKVLRQKLNQRGYQEGTVDIWYDVYQFGFGVSGVLRQEVNCNLYDSSSRYQTLQKKVTGWKRLIQYL